MASGRPLQPSDRRVRAEKTKPTSLSSGASEGLRLRLVSELEQLEDPEALASWAQRALPLKNQLTATDAQVIEDAFATRLTQLGESAPVSGPKTRKANGHGGQRRPGRSEAGSNEVTVIGKP